MSELSATPSREASPPTDSRRSTITHRNLTKAHHTPPGARRERILDEVVAVNLPLARSIAHRYQRRGVDLDDLEQVAAVGLVYAVRHFDLEREKDFLSYAVPTIRGHVRKHFRDAGWSVRPPRRLQDLERQISITVEQLTQEHGRSPRPREIADRLGVEVDDVVEALTVNDRGCFTPTHYDAPLTNPASGSTDSGRLSDTIPDDGPDDRDAAEARLLLAPAVRSLPERDRIIVRMRFFEGRTQSEIGQEIGVTQMQVSRLITRILNELRTKIDDAPRA
ncbi:MAG: sigma-70 family RNA polymerase sigma factor [Nocardioidaceae bacterium]|nr:sigma-70 family RNA polymerase sigma factor [Nocardioidaceae bacterium]